MWAPDFNCNLTFTSSWAMSSTSVGMELNHRFRASLRSLRYGWNQARILSERSIRPVMTGSRVGAVLFEPRGRLLCCLTIKPIKRLGDLGVGPPECDRTNRVLLVSTLAAMSWDKSSCPPSTASSCCHSMASGTFESGAILTRSEYETYVLSPPHTTGISKF